MWYFVVAILGFILGLWTGISLARLPESFEKKSGTYISQEEFEELQEYLLLKAKEELRLKEEAEELKKTYN